MSVGIRAAIGELMAKLDVGRLIRINGQKGSPSSAPEFLRIIAVEKGLQLAIVMPYALARKSAK
jgi:hypothetical protein